MSLGLWRARRDSNPRSSESESDAISSFATGTRLNSLIITHFQGKCKQMMHKLQVNIPQNNMEKINNLRRTSFQAVIVSYGRFCILIFSSFENHASLRCKIRSGEWQNHIIPCGILLNQTPKWRQHIFQHTQNRALFSGQRLFRTARRRNIRVFARDISAILANLLIVFTKLTV